MGVRPALPVEGIDIILGNDLAGSRVWASVSPPPVVTLCPSGSEQLDGSAMRFPEVFPACVVTRADSWSSHMQRVRALFDHLAEANLSESCMNLLLQL